MRKLRPYKLGPGGSVHQRNEAMLLSIPSDANALTCTC